MRSKVRGFYGICYKTSTISGAHICSHHMEIITNYGADDEADATDKSNSPLECDSSDVCGVLKCCRRWRGGGSSRHVGPRRLCSNNLVHVRSTAPAKRLRQHQKPMGLCGNTQ